MKIYFVRHGETDYNRKRLIQGNIDIPLNQTGIDQGEEAALFFKEKEVAFDRIYASPLSRAHKTGSLMSGWAMEEILTDDRLREMSFGETEGLHISQATQGFLNLFEAPHAYERQPGGESIEEMQARCRNFLEELIMIEQSQPEIQTVMVATHGACLRGLLSVINETPLEDFWIHGISNCAIVDADLINGEFVINEFINPIKKTALLEFLK